MDMFCMYGIVCTVLYIGTYNKKRSLGGGYLFTWQGRMKKKQRKRKEDQRIKRGQRDRSKEDPAN